MQVPLQISFHNMASSEAIEARVRERAARLERFFDGIISCRVTVEAPHKQPHRSTVGITIDIAVAGKEIVVKREQRHHETRDDAYQVIGVAFDAAERQLEEHARVLRREVKSHDGPVYARVVGSIRSRATASSRARAGPTSTFIAPWSRMTASTSSRSAARCCSRSPRRRGRWAPRRAACGWSRAITRYADAFPLGCLLTVTELSYGGSAERWSRSCSRPGSDDSAAREDIMARVLKTGGRRQPGGGGRARMVGDARRPWPRS